MTAHTTQHHLHHLEIEGPSALTGGFSAVSQPAHPAVEGDDNNGAGVQGDHLIQVAQAPEV